MEEMTQEKIEEIVEQAAEIVAAPKRKVNLKKVGIGAAVAAIVVGVAVSVPKLLKKHKACKEQKKIEQGGVDNIKVVKQDFLDEDSDQD